jgi:hypothetical protein|nr:MAG TPA: hypothetical protein [Caudoviricetes sp.]
MRKSNNYFKFLEYVTYGKDHDDTIDKGNGVLECKSYVSISDIEDMYKTTFGLENQWLTFKNILINEDTLYVYYLDGENRELVAVYLLDNFKTQKELKDSITTACVEFLHDVLLEKSEETEEPEETVKDIMEVKQALNARFGKEQYVDTDSVQPNKTIIAKIEDINYCPNQNTCCVVSPYVHCDYNYKSEACIKAHKNFIHDCEQVHKHLKAISNPEWHNVSLATLANIDFDMLDEKRQLYLSLYGEIKELLKDLHNCKSGRSYEKRLAKMYSRSADLVYENKVTSDYIRYVTRKVSMCNVECSLWTSANEVSTGYHKSRRYDHLTIRY